MLFKKISASIVLTIMLFVCFGFTAHATGIKYNYSLIYNGEQPLKLKNEVYGDGGSSLILPVAEIFGIIDPESKQIVVKTTNKEIESDKTYLISFKNSCYELGEKATNITVYDKTCSNSTKTVLSLGGTVRTNPDLSGTPIVYAPVEFFQKVFGEKSDIKNNREIESNYRLIIRTEDYKKYIEKNNKAIILKVNDPWMYVNDNIKKLDPDEGSIPVIQNGSTLLPIANIIKEFGGLVTWDGTEKKISVSLDKNNVDLWIDKNQAIVNGITKTLDVAPAIIANRTMVPLRFVSDNLGLKLIWDGDHQVIALYHGDFDFTPGTYGEYFNYKNNGQTETTGGQTNGNTQQNDKQASKDQPIDKKGATIQVGDRVTLSFFYGEVKKINGGRVLVYWDSKNDLWLKDKDIDYWAMLAGIKYKSSSWIDAGDITVDK